jgi:hypothetical protein
MVLLLFFFSPNTFFRILSGVPGAIDFCRPTPLLMTEYTEGGNFPPIRTEYAAKVTRDCFLVTDIFRNYLFVR